ncbi:MAG TPA: hypothetical protein VIG99_10590 [Myxococcaceae bacterium]|jgi:hypothetical protein
MPNNHLQSIEITPTVPRQTPRRDFSDVMGHAVATAAAVGADLIAPVASASPLLSAAVSAVKSVAQGAMAQAGTASVGVGNSDPRSMVDANRQLMQEGAQLNMQYLQLQHDMQQESQQYNTVSNVMKVRHDSAKAAINNIR